MKSETINKIFGIGLGISCIIIILIICSLLFSVTNFAIDTGLAFGVLLITIFLSIYIVPVVGTIFLILSILYAVKIIKYKGEKIKKVIIIIANFVLLVITFVSTYITLYQYLFSRIEELTEPMTYAYKIFGIITIILAIFLYITWTKQFKHIVEEEQEQIIHGIAINEGDKERKETLTNMEGVSPISTTQENSTSLLRKILMQ